MDIDTEVHGLADGITVRTVALRVGQTIEVIPCHEVVGVDEETALAHIDMFDPFLRE